MTKKSFNIAEIVCCIIILVLSWVDGTYKIIARTIQGGYRNSIDFSFVDCSIDSLTIDDPIFPYGWIFIALVSITLIILFVETLKNKQINKIIETALPIAALIAFLAISSYVDSLTGGTFWSDGNVGRSYLEMSVLFYVEVILLLICAAFSVLKNFSNGRMQDCLKAKGTAANGESDQNGVSLGVTDEIKELKHLLDAGIITQEEFDAKKKQLLNI